jgi:hypothetical protein
LSTAVRRLALRGSKSLPPAAFAAAAAAAAAQRHPRPKLHERQRVVESVRVPTRVTWR